jgi:signal transduction histidine kinase
MRSPARVALFSAVGIGAFQLVGSFGAAHNQSDRRSIDALAVLLVLAGPVALAWRDRWPMVAATIAIVAADLYIASGYPYGPIFVSVVVGLIWAVRLKRRRAVWLLAAAGYAGYVGATAVDPRSSGDRWGHLALVAGWLAVVIAVAELVKVRLAQSVERADNEREQRQRRVGEQRLLLAQELHDVLAHNISLINVQASVALHLFDEQPHQARPALTNIKQASHDALDELRSALDVLRFGELAPLMPTPTLADLDALLEGVRASGLEVRLVTHGPTQPLPAPIELAAYRIVQEALTNVTRHADATMVTVELRHTDGLRIEVTDNGRSRHVASDAGNGIVGMRERAGALGGSVEAGPLPGGGFMVTARLPLVDRGMP